VAPESKPGRDGNFSFLTRGLQIVTTEPFKTDRLFNAEIASRLGNRLCSALLGMSDAFWAWRARARSRRDLARLDDHILKDIGISRADAHRESSKPFWRE